MITILKASRMQRSGVVLILAASAACGIAQAQTSGSAWPADQIPEVDYRGTPITVTPAPENFDRAERKLERPDSIFFGEDGLLFDPEKEKAEMRELSLSSDEEPRILEEPHLGSESEAPKKRGFFRRLFGR